MDQSEADAAREARAIAAIRTWIRQTVLFAMNVRAMELGKPTYESDAPELHAYADEIWQRMAARAGPNPNPATPGTWTVLLASEVFRWVQEHLDR